MTYLKVLSTIGSPHFPYGRKALDTALVQLYGFYRTSKVVWICQDHKDWESMATLYQQEKQWPQVVKCVPCMSLVEDIVFWILGPGLFIKGPSTLQTYYLYKERKNHPLIPEVP